MSKFKVGDKVIRNHGAGLIVPGTKGVIVAIDSNKVCVSWEGCEVIQSYRGDVQDVVGIVETNVGIKHDDGKPDFSLLSPTALEQMAAVMSFGAKKYAAHNWRKGFAWTRVSAAALRHIFSWLGGETVDKESGLNHLAHAACCLMFLLEFSKTGAGNDDRYKGEST